MLGGVRVDHRDPLLDVVDQDDGGLAPGQGLPDPGRVLGGRHLLGQLVSCTCSASRAESVTSTAAASGSCSAWEIRSAATCTGSAVSSASTAISVGPASESMLTRPFSSRLAATT